MGAWPSMFDELPTVFTIPMMTHEEVSFHWQRSRYDDPWRLVIDRNPFERTKEDIEDDRHLANLIRASEPRREVFGGKVTRTFPSLRQARRFFTRNHLDVRYVNLLEHVGLARFQEGCRIIELGWEDDCICFISTTNS